MVGAGMEYMVRDHLLSDIGFFVPFPFSTFGGGSVQELILDLGQAVRVRKIQFLSHQFKIGAYCCSWYQCSTADDTNI